MPDFIDVVEYFTNLQEVGRLGGNYCKRKIAWEGFDMAKSVGKRTHNKQDINKVNRAALLIGGLAAAGILALLMVSFLMS